MNIVIKDAAIAITLSKRNLLSLLDKVDDPLSAKTIYKYINGVDVIVKAEPDDEHYGDRRAGPMSSRTEKFIMEYQ